MKISASLVLCAAALLAQPAFAQKWVVYSPPERDFRVLFPSEPVQSAESDGAVAFRAQQEIEEDRIVYVVFRLPASVQRTGDEALDIQKLLLGRLGGDPPRRMRDEEAPADFQGHLFEYRRSLSVNRIVGAAGRYYHLEVLMPRKRAPQGMQTARDFFASFQAGGVGVPGIMAGFTQQIDAWCQNRKDVFTRTFCEYSVCLQPGFAQNPKCAGLLKR
jgi:hypothetical protein